MWRLSWAINSQLDNILPLNCSNVSAILVDLCLVCIKLAQFNAFCCWVEHVRFRNVTNKQSTNSSFIALLQSQPATTVAIAMEMHLREGSLTAMKFLQTPNSLRQIAIMHVCSSFQHRFVWCSALCFWHVKFYHIWLNSIFCICYMMQKRSEAKARSKFLQHETFPSVLSAAVAAAFNTWEIYFQEGLICVFSWIHIALPHNQDTNSKMKMENGFQNDKKMRATSS